MTAFSKKLALGISAVALAAFVGSVMAPTSAEAGFGIKIPKISIQKNTGSSNATNTTNNNSNAKQVYRKTVKIHVMEGKFYKPIVGAEVYLIRTDTVPSTNDKQAVCTIDADYRLLGRTDGKGDFIVPPTQVPFGLVVSIPGDGVRYQSFPDIIEESQWDIRCPMVNKVYQRVQFTGNPF